MADSTKKKVDKKGDLTKYFNTIDFGDDLDADWNKFEKNIYSH